MKTVETLVPAAFLLAALTSCRTTSAPPPPPIPRVLMIGIDGLRPDALLAGRTPNLARLMAEGCYSGTVQASEHTVSGPGWSSILTGVWPDKHGSIDNEFKDTHYDHYPHVFVRLKGVKPDAYTASVVDWEPIDQKILSPFAADFRESYDDKPPGDEHVATKACEALLMQNPDFVFAYFAGVDNAGHDFGFHPAVPEYLAAIEQVDAYVGLLLRALHARPSAARENWLVLVSTDHGGTIDGSHGRDEPLHRTVFAIVSGPSARRGRLHETINQVDLAATALTHLGVAIDPAWGLDGRPFGLKGDTTRLGVNLIYNGDAELSTGYPEATRNAGIAGWTDLGAMTVIPQNVVWNLPSSAGRVAPEFGARLFCGGKSKLSKMSQLIDLTELAASIDRTRVSYQFSGYLGGHADKRDQASALAEFLDVNDGVLARTQLGPVSLAMRRARNPSQMAGSSGLLPERSEGAIPPGTRGVRITLVAEAQDEDNRGYADNLSLVLSAR